MVQLYDNDTGAGLGTISDDQLRFLQEHLEAEGPGDTDYYLTGETLDLLEAEGADGELLAVLRGALGDREGVEIRWGRD